VRSKPRLTSSWQFSHACSQWCNSRSAPSQQLNLSSWLEDTVGHLHFGACPWHYHEMLTLGCYLNTVSMHSRLHLPQHAGGTGEQLRCLDCMRPLWAGAHTGRNAAKDTTAFKPYPQVSGSLQGNNNGLSPPHVSCRPCCTDHSCLYDTGANRSMVLCPSASAFKYRLPVMSSAMRTFFKSDPEFARGQQSLEEADWPEQGMPWL